MMGWNEAVEVMARAIYEARMGVVGAWDDYRTNGVTKVSYRSDARNALTALLEATQSEPCATCWNDNCQASLGRVPRETHDYETAAKWDQCPDCTNGRVPGAPLVLLAPRQVGWVCPWKDGFVTYHAGDEPPSEKYAPLYAAQTEEKQT